MSWYTKKKDIMRVCRYCGHIFVVPAIQHKQCHCFDVDCTRKEHVRLNEIKRTRLKKHSEHASRTYKRVRRLNVKIRKKCLQCGRTYWDYGDCHFGRCPVCKQLDWYGDDDYGAAICNRQ
jgi:hypothetical protein